MYNLIVDEECKLHGTYEECLNYVVDNYKLVTKYYGIRINRKNINEWISLVGLDYKFIDDILDYNIVITHDSIKESVTNE